MRAAARGSVWMLNSARGVICGVWVLAHLLAYFDLTSCERHSERLGISSQLTFPGTSTAPPITTTSFTLANVSTSSSAANAKFVSGPIATIVTLFAS